MAFQDMAERQSAVALLQRSLGRGRLGHAYLFVGPEMDLLQNAAANLAKTLNCQNPPQRGANGNALDSCESCPECRKINDLNHPDVHWIRPESKSRVLDYLNQENQFLLFYHGGQEIYVNKDKIVKVKEL